MQNRGNVVMNLLQSCYNNVTIYWGIRSMNFSKKLIKTVHTKLFVEIFFH
jgi:hypothetical protein